MSYWEMFLFMEPSLPYFNIKLPLLSSLTTDSYQNSVTKRLPMFRKLIRNLFALDVVLGSGFFLWNHRYLTMKIKLQLLTVCGSTDTNIKIRS